MTLTELLESAIANRSLRGITLSKPVAGDARRLNVRPVELKNELAWQLTTATHHGETHENLATDALIQCIGDSFGNRFRIANVFTAEADFEFRHRPSGNANVRRSPPSQTGETSPAHNRTKKYLIPEGEPIPFLVESGVMTAEGRVRASAQKKFRQVNRFLELVQDVLGSLKSKRLNVVDFGCGKSNLTFALHHLLTDVASREVSMTGLDLKPHVIRNCNQLAKKLELAYLHFEEGDIAGFVPKSEDPSIDLVVSLHACDTATDAALAQAVRWKAPVILAAPCCQHEVLSKMKAEQPLAAMSANGVVRERMAALATDSLRARLMELAGYRVQIVEFIETEHTPKNLLLRCAKSRPDRRALPKRIAEYHALKQLLGIDTFALEQQMPPEVLKLLEPIP